MVLIFLTAFMLTVMTTPISMHLGHWLGLTDRPGGRRQHVGAIPRIGGIAIFTGFIGAGGLVFLVSQLGFRPPIWQEDYTLLTGVMLGSIIMFGYGLADDWREFSGWRQLGLQLVGAFIAIYYDIIFERVTFPLIGVVEFHWWITYPLTIFWIVGMINTVNWLDGLDGLAAGITAIASLLFAIHAYRLGQDVVYLFPLALMAACVGFLPFNFHPARVFMGSSGSMVLGYALATLSILAPAKVATALLVLGIPILDVGWLIMQRWRHRGNPMAAGRDHLHYRLYDLGFSQRQVVLLYYSFCAAFGMLALLISAPIFKLLALIMMGSLTLWLLWWLAKRVPS